MPAERAAVRERGSRVAVLVACSVLGVVADCKKKDKIHYSTYLSKQHTESSDIIWAVAT